MKIRNLVKKAHSNAVHKGFWDFQPTHKEYATKLALIHAEVSEALEALRAGQANFFVDETGKPEGVVTELADIVIRVCDLVGEVSDGVTFEAIIKEKMAYNATRPIKHGKKF